MKLFYSTTSPFARKVLMVLHVTNLIDKTELVLTNPLEDETFRQINPLGKIPALIDGNLSLADSPLICEYLDDLSVQNGNFDLFRKDQDNYYHVQRIHAQADGILDAAVAIVYEGRRSDAERSQYWLERWRKAIISSLMGLNMRDLGDMEFPNIGTLALIAALGYLDFRLTDLKWRTQHPELAIWFSAFERVPWVINTAPK